MTTRHEDYHEFQQARVEQAGFILYLAIACATVQPGQELK